MEYVKLWKICDWYSRAAESATTVKVLTKYPMIGDNTVMHRGAVPTTNPAMYTGTWSRCACMCIVNRLVGLTTQLIYPGCI